MKRLDQCVFEEGFVTSRSRAQDAIQEGRVFVNNTCITKNSFAIEEGMHIEVKDAKLAFASRAGYKLYHAITNFQIDLSDRIVMDVGASTGGFSDVCIKANAKLVYAIDVGKDQLIESLRQHPRVIEMSQCNCRYLTRDMFQILPDFACMDVSFISIKLILPVLIEVMDTIEMVVLIKPQFEAGKDHIGKNGIIKDKKVHIHVLQDMLSFVRSQQLFVHHLEESSILGRDGNKEFIMHIKKEPCHKIFDIAKIVKGI